MEYFTENIKTFIIFLISGKITRSAYLVPLTIEEHGPGLNKYLLTVSGARVDILLDDSPVCQLDGDAVVEQPHHV